MAVAHRTRRPLGRQTEQTIQAGPSAAGQPGHPPSGPPAMQDWHKWVILAGLITSAILEVMDTTIVNVALPRMSGNFGATPDEIAWVSTGYILSNVVVLPMTAWLSTRIGRKRYLSLPIGAFVLASLLCGLSHSLGGIVLFRVLQGGAGAALISTAQATLVETFPTSSRAWCRASSGWAWAPARPSARSSAAGSPATTRGAGAFSSTSPSASPR